MRTILFTSLALLALAGCNDKKTDLDLFDEGRVVVSLSADPKNGYEPLQVSFVGYLENRERAVTREITSAKWVITGSNGFERVVSQDSFNYQDTEENKKDTFYLDFDFHHYGDYKVKLILNEGEFVSVTVPIKVLEDSRNRRGFRN